MIVKLIDLETLMCSTIPCFVEAHTYTSVHFVWDNTPPPQKERRKLSDTPDMYTCIRKNTVL